MNQEIIFPCQPTEAVDTMLPLAEALEQFEREAEFGICLTGRYRCQYVVWGEGPPLVFVHGLCDDARSFVMPMSILSRHFRCISYDLPTGREDSARLGRYRHGDYVDDLSALLEHLEIEQTYLYGSSFGSTIALAAMAAMPKCCPRAIIQGGFACRPLAPAEVLLAGLARYWPGRMGGLPFREAILRYSHFHAFAEREPAAWNYYLQRCNAPPLAAVARRALTIHGVDLRELLPRIQQPVLLICGSGDPVVNRNCEQVLLEGLPSASRAEIEGCGHYPYFSHPEVLAELMLHFLTPLPCQGA